MTFYILATLNITRRQQQVYIQAEMTPVTSQKISLEKRKGKNHQKNATVNTNEATTDQKERNRERRKQLSAQDRVNRHTCSRSIENKSNQAYPR